MLNMNSEIASEKRRSVRKKNVQLDEISELPMTPSRKIVQADLPKTPVSAIKSLEIGLTPRRSGRKSIKPAQDYDEIVLNKRVLRSRNAELEDSHVDEHKWSPAKVGRTSQKRSIRKSRSSKKSKVSKNSSDEVSHSTEDGESDDKSDESKQATRQHTAEVGEEILNTTFDTDCEEKLKDEIELQTAENQKAVVGEEILNTTFDKDFEEKLEDEIEVETAENEKTEKVEKILKYTALDENHSKESDERSSIASNDFNRKDSEIVPTVLKLIKEGNELGCTPILYDDENNEVEKESEGNDLDCAPIFSDEILENVKEDIISEESKVAGDNDEVFEKTNKYTEHPAILNDLIDLVSDDEMPCLVLSDDDATETVKNEKESPNDTFNASDCVIISPTENSVKQNTAQEIDKNNLLVEAGKRVKQLQENYFSPTHKLAKNIPKIVFTNNENVSKTLEDTPRLCKKTEKAKISIIKGKLPVSSTPVSLSKRQIVGTPSKRLIGGTPCKGLIVGTPNKRPVGGILVSTEKLKKQESKIYRFQTPYKVKQVFQFGRNQDKENEIQCEQEAHATPAALTTLEPKEIVLRSIRKRSLSVTIDGDLRKRRALNVTFYSPANQTASVADVDKMLERNAAKSSQNQKGIQNQGYVTQRKRSISLDEKYLRPQPSKLPRPVRISPQKSRPTARNRLPNFAAIHQHQFEKMENLVDYVARKAERAQNLTSSALKALNSPSSATKKQKSTVAKSLALNSSNKDNTSKPFIFSSSSKDPSYADKPSILTPNKKNISVVLERNKSISDKLHKRTQRHIDMFKESSVEPKRSTNKNADIIRGVRSNRRFELMMKHRKTSGN